MLVHTVLYDVTTLPLHINELEVGKRLFFYA